MMDYSQLRTELQCGGKVKHNTPQSAHGHKLALIRKSDGHFDVYQCPHCGYYHVGHSSSEAALKQRRRKR